MCGGGWPKGLLSPESFWGLGVARRRGLDGRYYRDGTVGNISSQAAIETEPEDGSRPKRRTKGAQVQIAEALPEIVWRFVTEAKGGSIAHAKALAALGDMDRVSGSSLQRSRRREQSLTERLMRELRRGRENEVSTGSEERSTTV